MSFEETHNAPTTPTQDSGASEQPQTQQVSETSTPSEPPNVEQASEPSPQPAETTVAAAPRSAAHRPEKEPTMEDFATALETFEQEQAQTEAALNEEQVVTGTVLKVTTQYVVVDIGYKSEGVVPVAELQDHQGNVRVQHGDEIPVMRKPGHTEEGYI